MPENSSERKSQKPGCGVMSFALGALFIAGGVFLMNEWETLHALARAGAIVLVVVGTILALPLTLLLLLKLFMKVVFRRMARELGKAGAQMLAGTQAMYDKIHEFRDATDADFDSLDRDYYETTRRDLSERGYRHLGDLVDQTLTEMGQPSPPIRVMVSGDGTQTAAVYHVALPVVPPHLEGKRMLFCDVTSEFTDGTFLMTSNTQGLDMMTPPPAIHKQPFPLETEVLELIGKHEAEKSRLLAERTGSSCVIFATMDEVKASERRQQAIKNAFRKGIGYLDPEEVRQMAKAVNDDEEFVDLTTQAVEDARQRHRDDSGGSGS